MNYTIEITQKYIDDANPKWVSKPLFLIKNFPKIELAHYHVTELLKERIVPIKSLDTFIDGCPLENAINDVIGRSSIQIHWEGKNILYWDENSTTIEPRKIPITFARALDFIKRHRTGKSVKPFTYIIDL